MASKGKQLAEDQPAKELPYLNVSDLTFLKRDSRVTIIEASDKKNNSGYVFLVFLDNDKGSKRRSRAIVEHRDSEGHFMWFELRHNTQRGLPYLGKRATEVDKFDINLDNVQSEPQTDTDKDLKQEEQKDVTIIQQSSINAPPTLQVPFRHTTMSQTATAQTIMVQAVMMMMTPYDPRQNIKQA